MPTQQIVSEPPYTGMFLVLTVREGSEGVVREALGGVPGQTRSVSFRYPQKELLTVVGIGSDFWDRMIAAGEPLARPEHLHTFREIRGERHVAPSTPGDLLLHLRATSIDMCFEMARIFLDSLDGHVDVVDEVHGFRYFDNRDLLGFVDGTENPEGDKAYDTVTIQDGPYAGGSYVIVQRYTHNMKAWNELSVEEQEKAIGRTKLDDVELDDDAKPSNSHVALNDVEGDIYRVNMPFGSFSDGTSGTYFIGYAKDPAVTEEMLTNMFVGKPAGNSDRILDFSTAETGTLFFVPTVDTLKSL